MRTNGESTQNVCADLAEAVRDSLRMTARFATLRFGWPEAEAWKIAATKSIDDPEWSEDDRVFISLCKTLAAWDAYQNRRSVPQ